MERMNVGEWGNASKKPPSNKVNTEKNKHNFPFEMKERTSLKLLRFLSFGLSSLSPNVRLLSAVVPLVGLNPRHPLAQPNSNPPPPPPSTYLTKEKGT